MALGRLIWPARSCQVTWWASFRPGRICASWTDGAVGWIKCFTVICSAGMCRFRGQRSLPLTDTTHLWSGPVPPWLCRFRVFSSHDVFSLSEIKVTFSRNQFYCSPQRGQEYLLAKYLLNSWDRKIIILKLYLYATFQSLAELIEAPYLKDDLLVYRKWSIKNIF